MSSCEPSYGYPTEGTIPNASDIPSDGPSNVQADLDALDSRVSAIEYIESAADLETMFPAVGGVHTIDHGTIWRMPFGAAAIDISPNTIAGIHPGGIAFIGAQGVIQTNADAPLVSGEMNAITNVSLVHGVGASAQCVDVTSLSGRPIKWNNVALVGQRPGRISDAAGSSRLTGVNIIPTAPGSVPLEIDGTIGTILFTELLVVAPGTQDYTGVEVMGTASIGQIGFSAPALISTRAGDALLRVDPSATLPAPSVVLVTNGAVIGPAESLFDASGLGEMDVEVLAFLNLNSPASQWFGEVTLDTEGFAAISLTHSGGVEVMPTENAGATVVAQIIPESQRFTFERDGVQDAQLVSESRTDAITGDVSWFATVKRSGGSVREFTGWIQSRTGPDPAAWVTIARSKGSISLDTVYATVRGSAAITWDKTTEFRLVVQSTVGLATDILDYEYRVGPGHP